MDLVAVLTRKRARSRRHTARGARLRRQRSDAVGAVLRWVILIEFAYVFAFPALYMITTSLKTLGDIHNPTVYWIPRVPTLVGYRWAIREMGYVEGLRISVWTSIAAAVAQTTMGAMIAYGFARVRFPGREALFVFLLFTVVVPPQTIMMPQFMLYSWMGWTNTHIPLFVPGFMGWGVRGGILLIVYRQFFRGLPYELEDAARIDGAGWFRTFSEIMLPLAKPAILVVLVFSLTWTWNDAFVPWLVISHSRLMTVTQRLEVFYWNREEWRAGRWLAPNTFMAATTLTVLPLLIVYVIAQRQFTESIDRTGLVE